MPSLEQLSKETPEGNHPSGQWYAGVSSLQLLRAERMHGIPELHWQCLSGTLRSSMGEVKGQLHYKRSQTLNTRPLCFIGESAVKHLLAHHTYVVPTKWGSAGMISFLLIMQASSLGLYIPNYPKQTAASKM